MTFWCEWKGKTDEKGCISKHIHISVDYINIYKILNLYSTDSSNVMSYVVKVFLFFKHKKYLCCNFVFQVVEALLKVDEIMRLIMDGLKQRKLHKCVNLVLLSDHGNYIVMTMPFYSFFFFFQNFVIMCVYYTNQP